MICDMRNITHIIYMFLVVAALLTTGCNKGKTPQVTLETLLAEMVSVEESARYPAIPYRCLQVSSYDRSSVSPDSSGWFANNDGFGIVRTEVNEGRTERVLFDEEGPGVITRIWITTLDKRGTWRFYFDGSKSPNWQLPAYDLMKFNVPEVGRGLLQPHTSYTPDGKGGNTLFFPIPYAKGCKITFEDARGIDPTPKYYQINFRRYPVGTIIETLSAKVAKRAAKKIAETDQLLLKPVVKCDSVMLNKRQKLEIGVPMTLKLPQGSYAVYELKLKVQTQNPRDYAQVMRNIVLQGMFDGKETIWAPVSDFSGGGMGAPFVESWFLSADGKGNVTSRWLMPYRQTASVALTNQGDTPADVEVSLCIAPYKWDDRTLYFHASWRQERGIPLSDTPDNDASCIDWNFATIQGRGVYKGDVLTLYNHSPEWYGEGDEKIWVDNDAFPSHFGTGTEDYYNSSWAPVVPFHTPFGGAPRADNESSHGYNTFFRTRNLDGIPFDNRLTFDLEMLSWKKGTADYATTIFWYGDVKARAKGLSREEEVVWKLPGTKEEPEPDKPAPAAETEDILY